MKRHVRLEEISDGKLYGANDLVKADCHSCEGCSACCQGMGNSILLDPFDLFRLSKGTNEPFDVLLNGKITLTVVDGVILPSLSMVGEKERCVFLDENGRCSIHSIRPGICRMFPLGRYYENGGFRYFLQTKECTNQNRTKIKVKKWLDTPNLKQYEHFVASWHYFLNALEEKIMEQTDDDAVKTLNMTMLNTFYRSNSFIAETFFEQANQLIKECASALQLSLVNVII